MIIKVYVCSNHILVWFTRSSMCAVPVGKTFYLQHPHCTPKPVRTSPPRSFAPHNLRPFLIMVFSLKILKKFESSFKKSENLKI